MGLKLGLCSPCRHNILCSYLAQLHSTESVGSGAEKKLSLATGHKGNFQEPSNPTHLVVWLHIAGAPVPWVA